MITPRTTEMISSMGLQSVHERVFGPFSCMASIPKKKVPFMELVKQLQLVIDEKERRESREVRNDA